MKLIANTSTPHYDFIESPLCIAGVSTRIGGYSKPPFDSLNLGLNTADDHDTIIKNRNKFFGNVAPEFTIAYMQQMHSDIVLQVNDDFTNNTEGDAFFTTTPGVLLTISAADCGAILLHDEKFTIVAAIHCGWRGAEAGIIEKTISALEAYVKAEDLIAYIGPMIQQDYYEVGPEFLNKFPAEYFKNQGNKNYFSLNTFIEESLAFAGVGRVLNSRLATFGNPENFFSYRRDGETGRMNAYIGIAK